MQKTKNWVFSKSTILFLNHCKKPMCDVYLQKKSRREKESTKVIVFSCFHRYLFHLFQGSPGRRGLPGDKGPNGKRVRDEISQ